MTTSHNECQKESHCPMLGRGVREGISEEVTFKQCTKREKLWWERECLYEDVKSGQSFLNFAMDWMFVSRSPAPIPVHMLNPNLSVMVLGKRTFVKWLGHEDGAVMNGMSTLIKVPRELPCLFCQVRTQKKDGCLRTRKWAFIRHRICWCLDFRLPSVQTVRNPFLLFICYSARGVFVIIAWTDWSRIHGNKASSVSKEQQEISLQW